MSGKVELIPISEGNRITVTVNEKVIIGRGSSLGCNEKKISRHHAELLLKDDHTLWIKPTHANPVFFRVLNGKIVQLVKDVERQLKDGDQIGLLPSSYYFRVSFSIDVNNNQESDSDVDSIYGSKKNDDRSPVRSKSPDDWSPVQGYRRSFSNNDCSVFDFDENDANHEPKKLTPKRASLEKKVSADTPQIKQTPTKSVTPTNVSHSTTVEEKQDNMETADSYHKPRKLPKWMMAPTSSSTAKPTTTTSSSSVSRNSSYTNTTPAKRNLSFDGDSNGDTNDGSNLSDNRSPMVSNETKSPGRVLSKIPPTRSFDDDSRDTLDSITTKTVTPPKRMKQGGKRRTVCQFGASCYRKNPTHRAEQSHPGDSDYEDTKNNQETNVDDQGEDDKPECPFGKACYRQNPQHKRDFKH